MGKPRFEDNWRDFFEGAESDVPNSVWSKIEVDLVRAENNGHRKSIIFYRRLAAGVALVAGMLAAYITYDQFSRKELDPASQLVDNRTKESSTSKEQESLTSAEEQATQEDRLGGERNEKTGDTAGLNGKTNLAKQSSVTGSSPSNLSLRLTNSMNNGLARQVVSDENEEAPKVPKVNSIGERTATDYMPLIPQSDLEIKSKTFYEPNFPRKLPAMPSYYMANKKSIKDNNSEQYWAALGFAGGSYNPGDGTSNAATTDLKTVLNQTAVASAAPQSEQAKLGVAYSIGISLGTLFSKKWVLQSGIGYLSQQIDYTSNYTADAGANFSTSGVATNPLEAAVVDYDVPVSAVYITEPYTIRSANEYISLPVQIGYKVLDRKLGVQISTGVSSDLFIKNTLTDESGKSETFTQSAGSESPYRNINWTGLMGIELSHKIANRYRLAIVPGLRYSFTSILKDDAVLDRNPLVLDVGMRLKYIFN